MAINYHLNTLSKKWLHQICFRYNNCSFITIELNWLMRFAKEELFRRECEFDSWIEQLLVRLYLLLVEPRITRYLSPENHMVDIVCVVNLLLLAFNQKLNELSGSLFKDFKLWKYFLNKSNISIFNTLNTQFSIKKKNYHLKSLKTH